MKFVMILLAALLLLSACAPEVPETTQTTQATQATRLPETTQATQSTAPTTTAPTLSLEGWWDRDGQRFYLDAQGRPLTGWQEIEEKTYYFDQDGVMQTGWLTVEGKRYYLRPEGHMAKGRVEIDGVNRYFTSTGAPVLLVNPWNYIPEDYDPELVYSYGGGMVARECDQALRDMMAACKKAGFKPFLCSAYRSQKLQEANYKNQIQVQLNKGLSYEEAVREAGKIVAVPGTSEHQTGLAVDIMDEDYQYLDRHQAEMPTQKWLMEHCWEFGFILRYPDGSTEVTGIIYEPWHYRYVGLELARELRELGITLEEYLENLTE